MLPRERVLEAIAHRKTDRMPADYSGHQEVANKLIARLGLKDYEELQQFFHIDFRRAWFDYSQPFPGGQTDGYRTDMWGTKYNDALPDGHLEKIIYPFNDDTTVDDVLAHPWPEAAKLDYSHVKEMYAPYHDAYATLGAPWVPFFHEVGWMIGQENLFLWMCTKPEVVDAIIDGVVTYEVETSRRFFAAADGTLDIAFWGNDFGTQRGLVMSPAQWERFFRKPLKRFFDAGHEAGCHVMQHSCGGIRDIIPALIEDGVDMLDPIQPLATGMEIDALVRDFGRNITLHGGIDTQDLLPFQKEADVRAQVRHMRDLTREQGGYVLVGSQEYIEDIPLDNILAIYDENLKGR